MSLVGIASNMGTISASLEKLINGQVSPGVSSQLNCTSSSLQKFVDGGTSRGLAASCGTTSSNLQELRNLIGEQGAIGLIIGLAITPNK